MKSCILLRTYRKVPKSHGNNVFILSMCVYRPIECFYELSLIYFDIFCVNWHNVVLLNAVDHKNTSFFNSENMIFELAYSKSLPVTIETSHWPIKYGVFWLSTRPDCYELTISHCSLTPLHRHLLPPLHLFSHPWRTLTIFHRPLTPPCSPFLHLLHLLTYHQNSKVFSRTLTPLCRPLPPLLHPSVPDHCPLAPLRHLLTPPLRPLTLFRRGMLFYDMF